MTNHTTHYVVILDHDDAQVVTLCDRHLHSLELIMTAAQREITSHALEPEDPVICQACDLASLQAESESHSIIQLH